MCHVTGMQVLAGDIDLAEETFGAFFGLWQRYGLLPERFTLDMGLGGAIHPTEQYYPLRPELLESAFYLHEVCADLRRPCIGTSCRSLRFCITPCTLLHAESSGRSGQPLLMCSPEAAMSSMHGTEWQLEEQRSICIEAVVMLV